MMASNSDNLYVTYVDVDRDLLKIWGQRNRMAATYVEKQLLQLLPEFNRAPCPNPAQIHKGMFCFAKYTDDNYYRARVISRVQADSVGVLFVDYGNKDIIKLSNIRIQEGSEGDVLAKMAEQAEDYFLSGVVAPPPGWTKEIVSEIRRDICYEEFHYQIVSQVGDQKILEIQFRNEDFSSYLVRKQLASPLSLPVQRQMILTYCSLVSNDMIRDGPRAPFSPSVPPPSMRIPLRPPNERVLQLNYEKNNRVNFNHPPPPVQYSSPRSLNSGFPHVNQVPKNTFFPPATHPSNPIPISSSSPQPVDPAFNPMLNNQFSPLQMVKERLPFNNNSQNIIQLLAQQVKQYIAEDNAKTESESEKPPHHYVNSVLEVGTTYNVLISFIDDGPWSFSIQLLSSETELQKLMDELSTTELVPIKPPIILGSPCIASSALYGNLCRGVVVSISHSAVKVYFVDFGNTEDLPSSSIYELPVKFFKIRVLSQKFSLSGLQKVAYSEDIKKFFKEVVQDELLMLRVTSLEDDNLPTCELYLKDKNIKRILNEKIRELRTSVEDFPKVGDTENVLVTWIVSPQKFFVQLHKRDADLAALKKELAEVETKGQRLTYQQLSVGFKCVCQYKNDGHWYRAVITSVDSESAITVFYVDYGNTEIVSLSRLRRITSSSLVNQMSNQAIQCTLKGFEDKPFDQGVTTKLEGLILEKELEMKVVSLEKELLCVQLFENGRDIASELLVASPPKLDLLDTSSMSRSDVLSCWDSPPSQEKQKKQMESVEPYDRTDNKNSRDRNRQKNNSGRQMNKLQGFKSPNRPAPPRSKRRAEDDTWRNDKPKDNHWNEPNQNSHKPRGGKQNDFLNDWDDPKPSTWKSNRDDRNENGRNRGPRETRDGLDWGNDNGYGERKREDGKFNGEGRRLDRNRGRDDDFKKKFDRNGRNGNGNEQKRSESSRKPIRKEDVVPPGSKYEERVLELNTCERGIVTYYFSPHEFYVQLLAQENEFKTMMRDIQAYYSDKYSLRDPVQAGDIVIAQFSLDKVLYRAEVVKPSPVTVRYVDYGNQEPVQAKGTWLLDKQFLKLPKQVIKCRLSDIQPLGSDWPPPGGGIDKFFESSEFKCTFLSFDNDTYEVSLENVESGKDVASEIVTAGLASRTPPKLDVPEIDFDLLPKQVLRLFVSHVESTWKFHVVLNSKALGMIKSEIKTLCENKNLIPLSEALIKSEMPCLTTNDNVSWYRGKIVKTDENKILVWFSDRGDTAEVERDKVMVLPDYLKVFQPQAVECSLYGTSVIKDEEFKKAVEGKHHLASIVSVSGEKLTVVLYKQDGQKFDFQRVPNFPQTVEPIGQLPLISQRLSFMISHTESPKEIYVQYSADWDDIGKLSEQLANFYAEKEGFDTDGAVGALVAAKSVVYETWYRGRLVSVSDEGLEVFYVDYGNKEILPRENVKKLDSSFVSFSAFCRKLSLDGEFDTDKTEDLKVKILELCQDKELLTYLINKNGEFLCEFMLDNERVTPMLKSAGLSENEQDNFLELLTGKKTRAGHVVDQSRDTFQSESETNELKAFVSHIESPKLFYVHKETTLNELQKFQDKLQKCCESLPVKQNLQVGDIVAVVFSYTWYRAKVRDVNKNIANVQFIDYGNTLDVDLGSSSVKELTNEFVKVPVFATPFSLRGTWSEDLTPKFEGIILRHEDPVTVVVLEESDPPIVDLFQNGQSCAEMLEKCGGDEEEEREEDDLCTAYITYSRSPCDFYVQRESCTDVLNRLTEQLLEADSFESPSEVEENKTYAAKFPDDGAWYRAKVTKNQGGEIEVHFIDYGNTSKVSEVRCLPKDIVDIPHLAERCCLLYGENTDDWSEAACEKFAEFADGRELKMKIVAITSKNLLVDLYQKNASIREEMAQLCEQDERREVYVSHALSPTDFYIQYVDDDQYKLIAEALETGDEAEDLEEKLPDTLCQARFADDGYWYRAKIIENVDEGCEVYFIDFGNVAVSKDLKKLPEEIKEIPPRALRCSLKLRPRKISEGVKQEFINLTAGGAAVFRARIVVPGEVNIISLKLGGRILEETLCSDDNEANDFSLSECHEGFSTSETDDGKNSKMNLITKDYLISDLEVDLTGGCLANETDEEKSGKISYKEADGFKSDDEKEIEGTAPAGLVNATDSELMEEVREATEWGNSSEMSTEDSIDDVLETVAEVDEEVEEGEEKMESWEKSEDTSTEGSVTGVVPNGVSHHNTNGFVNGTHKDDEHAVKFSRNKVHKIVPGCISRGEEDGVSDAPETAYQKIKYSDKLVPGCVSRGVSLESVANKDEPLEKSPEPQASRSAPTTPKQIRRSGSSGYVKIDPNDRLVPGCISTGMPLLCSPAGEKIPATEKIVSGAVNGSFEDN